MKWTVIKTIVLIHVNCDLYAHMLRGQQSLELLKMTQWSIALWVINRGCSVKLPWYWLSSLFGCLWTEKECRSENMQKKNRAISILIIWLASWAGKRCDWLPEQAKWRFLARSRLLAVSHKQIVFFFPYNKSFNLLFRSRWLDIGLVLFCFWGVYERSTPTRCINTQKRPIFSHLDLTLSQ